MSKDNVNREDKSKEEKPLVETKSSMEILSELFSTFDAEPPVIVKREKDVDHKKVKKSKKKHKHKDKKDKKHKKRSKKKRKKSDNSSGSESEGIDVSELIKTEITSTLLSDPLQQIIKTENPEIKQAVTEQPLMAKIKDKTWKVNNDNSKSNDTITKLHKDENDDGLKNHKFKITFNDVKADSLTKQDENRKSHKRKKHDEHYEKHNKSDDVPSKKKKHCRSKSRSKSRENSKRDKKEDSRYNKIKDRSRSRSPRPKIDDYYDKYEKGRYDKSKNDYKHGSKDCKSKDDIYKERDSYKYKDDIRYKLNSRWHDAKDDDFYKNCNEERRRDERYKLYDRHRTTKSSEKETRFDKKKLLEIARKNAIQMMKSGKLSGAMSLGPQAQEKVIAAISGGGKTIEELTDFCKSLSKKEELGELSSVSSASESESEEEDITIRHPFQIKEKSFTINIKNSVPLPTRTNQERASELRIQFPVSSGQHHRKTESEWVPVSPKKIEPQPKHAASAPTPTPKPATVAPIAPPLPIEPPPLPPAALLVNSQNQLGPLVQQIQPVPQIMPTGNQTEQEIASIVSQRLAAMRKLQENPNDSEAIIEMYNSQKGMNTWAESKLPLGQFTGTTGANILSQAQLASGYQAWARKDQLQTAAPVSGGMGMHLLQKMGWRPGEGLGKEKSGALEPLLLEVKLDKKGVIAKEECKKKVAVRIAKQTVKMLEGKHPVSLLHEYASKKKLGPPEYVLDFECGPDHMKNFLFKVILNGQEYKPNVASGNKKDAKALAATICLQGLGLLSLP